MASEPFSFGEGFSNMSSQEITDRILRESDPARILFLEFRREADMPEEQEFCRDSKAS